MPFLKLLKKLKNLNFSYFELIYAINEKMQKIELRLDRVERRQEFIQEALGRIEARQLSNIFSSSLFEHEFRVFSQWGEDGIIQILLKNIEIKRKIFVEFGSDNYNLESNTRFLLTNNNWSGLVIDSNVENINRLKSSPTYWLYNLKAVQAFITKDNINQIIKENGITGEIGLLSIDIDGNDYWIWQVIDVIDPIIVIVEYNARFGRNIAVTVPYNENFDRATAHPSMFYHGASLRALCLLAERKEYAFIGCNRNGVNAFFVRKDKKPNTIKELSPEEGYVPATYSNPVVKDGIVTKISPEEEASILLDLNLPLVNVEAEKET
jgi:hypothetical protein